ncbi:MarR family winged helix-turn-helix transcriptional regulator [Rhizobium mesosinicum]|uniref:MarR family transcriptional regulator n=1 Tax=Rhizobium mesosinicum TaxID=335017 RepID=A0ABS7GS73_9HYPH|nr:MarR family transcriptional regulator [Rhizobium mesosinicum]MBW9052074.1 MarR family transcriptional regulator [Rhizobium mesosinicum]
MPENIPEPNEAAVAAWTRLMRARERLLGLIEADLKTAGMPPLAWYDVLWELARSQSGRLRPYELEERTLLAQYNLSRLIDRLEKEGLVAREVFAEDGRGRWVVITDAGRQLRERMWNVYGKAIKTHIGDKLAEGEARTIAGLLDRFL